MAKTDLGKLKQISQRILIIRGQKVLLDTDLSEIYGIPTFRFNEAVKRNRRRFPDDFMFQLTERETTSLISQIAMSKKGRGGRRTRPYVFTEHGAIMAAHILHSDRAVQMSVFVVRAFIRIRTLLSHNRKLSEELKELEKKLTQRLDVHEFAIVDVLRRIMRLLDPPKVSIPPKPKIGFHF